MGLTVGRERPVRYRTTRRARRPEATACPSPTGTADAGTPNSRVAAGPAAGHSRFAVGELPDRRGVVDPVAHRHARGRRRRSASNCVPYLDPARVLLSHPGRPTFAGLAPHRACCGSAVVALWARRGRQPRAAGRRARRRRGPAGRWTRPSGPGLTGIRRLSRSDAMARSVGDRGRQETGGYLTGAT